jgi:amino acid transporter
MSLCAYFSFPFSSFLIRTGWRSTDASGPVAVFVCLLAQPRLLLAKYGLLPEVFGRVDPLTENLWSGTLISGTAMTLIAAAVPFDYLDSLISADILVAFSISDSCLVLMRQESIADKPFLLYQYLLSFHALSFTSGLLLTYFWQGPLGILCCAMFCLATFVTVIQMAIECPLCSIYCGVCMHQSLLVIISRLVVHEWITIDVLLAGPAWNLVLRHVLLGDVCNSDSDGNRVSSMLDILWCVHAPKLTCYHFTPCRSRVDYY